MNRRFTRFLRNVLAVLVLSLAVVGLPSSGAGLQGGFDYVFVAETEQLKDEFEYKGSKIGPVVKVSVSYYQPNVQNSKPIRYENLWYHGWQVLGCRRYRDLNLGFKQVAIEMKHKEQQSTKAECSAGANAMLRLYLEILMSRSFVSTFIVPELDFGSIEREMSQAGFTGGDPPEPEKPTNCVFLIPLRSSTTLARRYLYYY